jgi:hypothetical protein
VVDETTFLHADIFKAVAWHAPCTQVVGGVVLGGGATTLPELVAMLVISIHMPIHRSNSWLVISCFLFAANLSFVNSNMQSSYSGGIMLGAALENSPWESKKTFCVPRPPLPVWGTEFCLLDGDDDFVDDQPASKRMRQGCADDDCYGLSSNNEEGYFESGQRGGHQHGSIWVTLKN